MATFTEFCCRSGGSNLNAGTRTGSTTEPGTTADLTYASGTWANSTRTFTVASGNPVTDGVAVGDYVALDTTSGTPPATYGGRVSSRTATTIVVDSSANWGTNPANGTYTLRVGGAWAGPSGASGFPLSISVSSAINAASDPVRINLKNNQTYAMTAAIASPATATGNYHGYTSTYGDGGRATIDGGTSGASYNLLSWTTGSAAWFDSVIFSHNGSTGSATGVQLGLSSVTLFTRCVFAAMVGYGVGTNTGQNIFKECEIYGNNTSNTTSLAGIQVNAGVMVLDRCTIHDNTGSNTSGVRHTAGALHMSRCIIESNGKHGISAESNVILSLSEVDIYSNAGDGINFGTNSTKIWIESCNFVKNATWGLGGTTAICGLVLNCGFGSGTQANGSGTIQSTRLVETGSVTYAANVTPWVDPANGDFRINLAAARGAGRGAFTQTASSYAGAVGYPDIGAAQHIDTPAISAKAPLSSNTWSYIG